MYAGMTLNKRSGKIIGVHQKIDRVAKRNLNKYIPRDLGFPTITNILKFEGKNGPDAVKYTNLGQDKPWHFIDPKNNSDTALLDMIDDHIESLALAIRDKNSVKASFEAAWLAHAVVDGLTPAHHYPLGGKVEELWGKPRNEFKKLKDKHVIKGDNPRDTISKNWEYWGMGGLITDHIMFEIGVAMAIVSSKFKTSGPNENDIICFNKSNFRTYFLESLHKINELKMYERFGIDGWNLELAKVTRRILVPIIIKCVTLAWYAAAMKAEVGLNDR